MSCPHARGGERGLKGNLVLSKLTGKYSLAISWRGKVSEGMLFSDQTGQYLLGKKGVWGKEIRTPVSRWKLVF